MIVHGECGKAWTGGRREHCPRCHETFNSTWAADQHRRKTKKGKRICIHPLSVDLVPVEYSWGTCWQDEPTVEAFYLGWDRKDTEDAEADHAEG